MLKMVTEKYHNNEIKHLGLIYNDFEMDKGYGYGYGYGMVTDTDMVGYFDEDANYEEPTLIKLRNKLKKKLKIK